MFNANHLLNFGLLKAGLFEITNRYTLGAFGRGETHSFAPWGQPWNGGLLLHYPNGSLRFFLLNTTDTTQAGVYMGSLGDYGKLSFSTADQTWYLTEPNGIMLHFPPDPQGTGNILLDYLQDLNGNRATLTYLTLG